MHCSGGHSLNVVFMESSRRRCSSASNVSDSRWLIPLHLSFLSANFLFQSGRVSDRAAVSVTTGRLTADQASDNNHSGFSLRSWRRRPQSRTASLQPIINQLINQPTIWPISFCLSLCSITNQLPVQKCFRNLVSPAAHRPCVLRSWSVRLSGLAGNRWTVNNQDLTEPKEVLKFWLQANHSETLIRFWPENLSIILISSTGRYQVSLQLKWSI